MHAPYAWLRSPRAAFALNAALVSLVFGVGLIGHIEARTDADVEAAPLGVPIVLFAAAAAVALWWRRTRPLQMFGVLFVVAVIAGSVGDPALFTLQLGIEMMVLFHAAGSWCSRPRLALGVVVLLVLIGIAARSDGTAVLAAGAFGLALVAFPFAVGYAARVRRQYLEQVEQRLADAERDRDERARRAIEEERTRIARELHDVVAHHVSLIGVQAGAARTALDSSPDATRAALAAIEASSRDAVGEMRRLLDALRPLDDSRSRAPQPGLDALPALVERMRAAGIDVTIRAEGLPPDGLDTELPPSLSLTCYRIAEESLTNIVRHSQARTAVIDVAVRPDAVVVSVHDPGPARAVPVTDVRQSCGRGLRGMAERVALFDGTLRTEPTAAGGFLVAAVIPRAAQ